MPLPPPPPELYPATIKPLDPVLLAQLGSGLFLASFELKIFGLKNWIINPTHLKIPRNTFWDFICLVHFFFILSLLFKIFAFSALNSTYSTCQKSPIFCFAQLLLQILVNYQNQGQFWNLLVLSFPKLSLKVKFDQDLAEIIKVKDKWSVSKNACY